MRRHVSKLFIDSRYTLPDGSFVVPGEQILIRPETRIFLHEYTCCASWDTIEAGVNDTLVVHELGTPRTITIPSGPHDLESLRDALETELNGAGKALGMGTYTVTRVSTGTGGSTFRSFRVECDAGVFSLPTSTNALRDIVSWPTGDAAQASHTSGFVDVRRVHSIYLHCDFGNHNAVGPTGVRGLLAKVPVLTGYGGLVHHTSSGGEHDFILSGSHSLSTFKITLHDAAGRLLDLKGTSWSATMVFDR